MAREGEEENVPVLSSTTTSRRRIRRGTAGADPLLSLCRCFRFITSFAAILCIVVNVLSAIRSFKNGSDIFDGIFRCYAVFIACFVVLAETEWNFIIKFWQVLEYWVGRGMLQIFVAVMTRAFPDFSGERKQLVVLQYIACYILLTCGLVYVISGILCIGCLKRHRQKQEITKEQAAKDLEELERRREELEQLLVTE
ncbi:Golgi apparatus membrane protein TVP15 [Sesbania bispinosa]|nr:Golgi apparatus membrane protein TVP15 [Sesbania bispinosa]